jgi:hypothetical protein
MRSAACWRATAIWALVVSSLACSEAYYRTTNQLGRVVEDLGREEEAIGLYYESLAGLKGAWGVTM